MKALSIQQPWAWLIVHGYKDVENRTWETRYRGPVLIHTGKKADREGYQWVRFNFPEIPMPMLEAMPRGGIVGRARITDCTHWGMNNSPWFFGPWGFILDNAEPVPFQPGPGKLGFFEWNG